MSVAPLCLIAIKLHAANSDNRPHDLEDACAAMQSYEKMGPRRFDIDYEQFDDLTFEIAGAFLAGIDTVQMASPVTRELIEGAIESLLGTSRLTERFADGELWHGLLLAYQVGLEQYLEPLDRRAA